MLCNKLEEFYVFVFEFLDPTPKTIKLGHSEKIAFRMIYKDFLTSGVKNSNWQNHFADVFGISVKDFYYSLKAYTLDINSVLPSKSLSIKAIFN